jgi:GAF domain-containing protein
MVVDVVAFATALSTLGRLLTEAGDGDVAVQKTAESVSRVLALAGAGVCLAERNRLRAVAATTASTEKLERCQEELQEGPGRDCYETGKVVAVTDLNDWSARWPRYADTAQQLRLAAVASIPMGHDAHRLGVLDLYDSQPHAWSDEDLRISAAFADLTAGFLIQASQLSDQQRLNEHLERALQTRILIEQAKGIIANHHNISPEHAFDVIRKYARSRRVTLAEVSRHIIYQGVRPAVPAPSGQPARPRSTR